MSGANFWIDRTFGFHVSLDDPRSSLLFFFSHDTRVLLVSMSMWGRRALVKKYLLAHLCASLVGHTFD